MQHYEIYFIESDRHWYVGSTTRGHLRRFQEHLFKTAESPISPLHHAGVEFSISVLEEGDGWRTDIIRAEQDWYERKMATESRLCINREEPGRYRPKEDPLFCALQEAQEFVLSLPIGQALAKRAMISLAESVRRQK